MREKSFGGLFDSLRCVLDTGISILKNRAELAAIELKEERVRLISATVFGGLFLLSSFMAVITIVCALFFFFWEQRLWVAVGLFAFCLIGALVAFLVVKSRLKAPGPLVETIVQLNLCLMGGLAVFLCLKKPSKTPESFSETIAQLKKDRAWLQGKN